MTFTLHGVPPDTVPVHVLPLASEKSRPVAPCVTIWIAPTVVVDARLKVRARLLLHGSGLFCPKAQTLMLPKF